MVMFGQQCARYALARTHTYTHTHTSTPHSCTLSGVITEWDRESHDKLRSISVSELRGKFSSIRTMCRVDGTLWVGTGTVIIVVDLESGTLRPRPISLADSAGLTEAMDDEAYVGPQHDALLLLLLL
jgi:hypothetical protein